MKRIIKSLTGLALCAALFSFSKIGGESYTIQLNDKLLVEHFLTSKDPVPSFSLAQAATTDQLSVYFNECGKVGKERKLTVKDEKENVLKEWRFENSAEQTPMICKVKDIKSLKLNGSKLKLYYASQGKTAARLLAVMTISDELKARK